MVISNRNLGNSRVQSRSCLALGLISMCRLCSAQSEVYSVLSEQYVAGLGENVVALGDVDGDGVRDFAGLTSNAELNGPPAVTIFSGRTAQILSHVQQPTPVGSQTGFGEAMDGGADVDGDGEQDLLIGAPYGSLAPGGGWVSSNGAAYLVRANDGMILRTHLLPGVMGQSGFGYAVQILGDLNDDGHPEYVVSAVPSFSSTKSLVLFDGWSGASLATHTTNGFGGYSILRVPDITSDGRDDFAVGRLASVDFYSYGGGGITLVKSIIGGGSAGDIGFAMASMGDIDGDGGPDIATSYGNGIGFFNIVTGVLIRSITASGIGYPLGRRMAPIEDLDGDARSDLLASEWFFSGPAYYAKLIAFSSGTGARLYEHEESVITQFTISTFPSAIANLGDVDGDGRSEWAIGNYKSPPTSTSNGGMIQVLSSRPLYSKDDEISPSDGSTVKLDLNGGLKNAGRSYFILSSFTGTSGISVGAAVIPISFDALTEIGILYVNTPVFDKFSGALDSNGNAHATFDGALIPPAAQGLVFNFAYVIYGGTGPYVASNPHSVAINVLGP